MEIKDLTCGRPVEISILKEGQNFENKSSDNIFISSLFDITDKEDVVIHMPSRQGRYISLPLNIKYLVVIYTNVGIFQFVGLLIKQGKLENFPVYVLRPETKLEKIQRRNYYRFNCTLPVSVVPITKDIVDLPNMELVNARVLEDYSQGSYVDGTILDISGGGARFTANQDIATDAYMYLCFTLEVSNGQRYFKAIAKRVKSEYKKELGVFEHRVKFVFKDIEDRETIIKYIFDEDRRLRKKDQG